LIRRLAGKLALAIGTGFGSGYFPIAPGTVGSAVGLALYAALVRLGAISRAFSLGWVLTLAAVFVLGWASAWHLERRPPDWDALLELAQRWGGEKILLTGLGLAATLFDLVLPDRIAVLIQGSPGVRRLIARQSQRIFEDDRLAMLRLRTLPEFLRMHWTQLGDPVHFARWMALKLTTSAVEDLEPEDARGDSVGRKAALAPVQALRRLLRGRG